VRHGTVVVAERIHEAGQLFCPDDVTQAFVGQVREADASCRRTSHEVTGDKAAEAYEVEQRAQRARGTWVDPSRADVLFGEVARTCLEGSPSKRGSGLARDESIVRNRLLPAIGERKLGSFTPRDVQAMVTTTYFLGNAPSDLTSSPDARPASGGAPPVASCPQAISRFMAPGKPCSATGALSRARRPGRSPKRRTSSPLAVGKGTPTWRTSKPGRPVTGAFGTLSLAPAVLARTPATRAERTPVVPLGFPLKNKGVSGQRIIDVIRRTGSSTLPLVRTRRAGPQASDLGVTRTRLGATREP
jgi:hypothetical protein